MSCVLWANAIQAYVFWARATCAGDLGATLPVCLSVCLSVCHPLFQMALASPGGRKRPKQPVTMTMTMTMELAKADTLPSQTGVEHHPP